MTLQLVALSGDNVFLLLLLIAVLAFVLGIGLPTVSVYILTATLLAPALVKLGVTPMAAHMFVMYNGMLSMITPPVAFAAYAAASIARTDGWTTGWVACLVGWSTFVLPFLFVLTPSLLMDGPVLAIVFNFSRVLFGLFLGTAAVVGFALAPLTWREPHPLRRPVPAGRAAAGNVLRGDLAQRRRHRCCRSRCCAIDYVRQRGSADGETHKRVDRKLHARALMTAWRRARPRALSCRRATIRRNSAKPNCGFWK